MSEQKEEQKEQKEQVITYKFKLEDNRLYVDACAPNKEEEGTDLCYNAVITAPITQQKMEALVYIIGNSLKQERVVEGTGTMRPLGK